MPFTDMTGLAGSALVIAAAVLRLPGVSRLGQGQRAGLAVVAFAVALVPIGGLSLAAYLRGGIGDLSMASLVLLLSALWRSIYSMPGECTGSYVLFARKQNRQVALLLLLVILALALYPMSLGWGSFDPYRLGYGDPWLLSGLLALAIVSVMLRKYMIAMVIALAVLAWSVGWYESTNLWDYLLDPLVSIYAAGALARRLVRNLRRGKTV
jgi:hypothetical protein